MFGEFSSTSSSVTKHCITMRGFCISKAVKFKGKPVILFLVPNPVLVKKKKNGYF